MSTTVEYILDVETQKAQAGLKRTEAQTKRTSRSLKDARRQARGLSGSFQFLGEATSAINPQLAGLADVAMNASSALRGLGRAFASGNPLIIGATAAIVAAIGVYTMYTASVRRNEESIKKLNETLEKNTAEIQKNQQAFNNAESAILDNAGGINALRLRYAELSGEISKSEAAEAKRFFTSEQGAQKLQDELQKQIKSREDSLALAKASAAAIKERLGLLADTNRLVKFGGGATAEAALEYKKQEQTAAQIVDLERELTSLRTDGAARIQAQSEEFTDLQEKIAKLLEKQRKKEEAIKRAKERQTQLQSLLNSLQGQSASIADRVLNSEIARMQPMDRINAQYQREIDNLASIEQGIIKQFNEGERVARSKKDRILLSEIQKQKTEALAQVEAARGEAEITRNTKITSLILKNTKLSLTGIKKAVKGAITAMKALEQARARVEGIIEQSNSDQLSAVDKINKLERDRLKTLREIGAQQGINTDEAQRAVTERAERDRRAARQQQTAQGFGVAETVVRATFDAGALITAIGGAFGPVGSAVAGVVTALSDLGKKDPEEIKEEFKATVEGIAKGLRVIVPLIFEMLPPILFDAAKMIIFAIAELPARLGAAIADTIGVIFKTVITFFNDPIGAIAEGIGKILKDFVSAVVGPILNLVGIDVNSFMSGGRMTSAQGGIRFTGASRGLAMLHEGEAVIPRSGQISSSVARDAQSITQGGKSVTVVINSAITERSAIDALVRKIEERFGDFGQSTSPLFGGL